VPISKTVCATAVAVALFAAPGCTKLVAGNAVQGAGAPDAAGGQCTRVDAPLTSIEPRAVGEPRLQIPQPTGWQRAPLVNSPIIRYTMDDKALTTRRFTPTAVVTLESEEGDNQDEQKIFEQERAQLINGLRATRVRTAETTLCGLSAEMVSYDAPRMGRVPPRKVKTVMVAGAFKGNTYVATVTVQSTDPANPIYVRDTATILAGFQMLPPAGG
jgi:Probable lipoprotein LpqN